MYETYYSDAARKAGGLIHENTRNSCKELLCLYFDSKQMTRKDIFNKYKLNQTVYAYTKEKSDQLWDIIAASFGEELSETDKKVFRIIVDGTLEKLCEDCTPLEDVIERLVDILW